MKVIVDLLNDAGVVGVLVFVLILIYKGYLVPKSYVDELRGTNQKLLDINNKYSESLDTIAKASEESLDNSKVTLKAVRSLRSASNPRRAALNGDESYDDDV